jgi:hypothetical protein
MAIVHMDPVEVQVKTSWLDGSPREISWGDVRLPVRRVAAVRRETAAFRASVGPRTIFEVEAGDTKLSLTYRHRSRRWTVDGVDDEVGAVRPWRPRVS